MADCFYKCLEDFAMTGSQNDKKSRTTLVSVISEMLIPLALKAASDSFQESHFEEGKIRTLAPSHK